MKAKMMVLLIPALLIISLSLATPASAASYYVNVPDEVMVGEDFTIDWGAPTTCIIYETHDGITTPIPGTVNGSGTKTRSVSEAGLYKYELRTHPSGKLKDTEYMAAIVDVEPYEEQIADLEEQREELEDEIADLEDYIADVEGQLDEKEEEIADLKDEIAGLNELIAAKNAEIAELQGRIDELENIEIVELEGLIASLKARIAELEAQVAAKQEEIYHLNVQLSSANATASRLRGELDDMTDERDALVIERDDLAIERDDQASELIYQKNLPRGGGIIVSNALSDEELQQVLIALLILVVGIVAMLDVKPYIRPKKTR